MTLTPPHDPPQLTPAPGYQRIVVKLSGESFPGPTISAFTRETIHGIAREVKEVQRPWRQVAIMVGGGNIFRGARQKRPGHRPRHRRLHGHAGHGDQRLALQDALEKAGCHTRLMSAIEMHEVAEPFIRRRATRHLEKAARGDFRGRHWQSLFFDGYGRGAARHGNQGAGDFEGHARGWNLRRRSGKGGRTRRCLTASRYLDVLQKGLSVMDSTAISLCMDNKMPIVVFNMNVPGNLKRVVMGERVGSVVEAA